MKKGRHTSRNANEHDCLITGTPTNKLKLLEIASKQPISPRDLRGVGSIRKKKRNVLVFFVTVQLEGQQERGK